MHQARAALRIARELRYRLDSDDEPIEDTLDWFLEQGKIREGRFADQDPFVRWHIIDAVTAFIIECEWKVNPGKPFTEIARGKLLALRRLSDLAKPAIDRLTQLLYPVAAELS